MIHIQLNELFSCFKAFSQKLTEYSLLFHNEACTAELIFSGVLMFFHKNYLKTSLFAQIEPYTAKVSFSGVLKHFGGN